jgi:hypothetical protein
MGSCGGGVIDLERLRSLFRFREDVSLREAFGVFSVISKSSSSLSEERLRKSYQYNRSADHVIFKDYAGVL